MDDLHQGHIRVIKDLIQVLSETLHTPEYVEFLDEIWKWAKDRADKDRGKPT